MALSDSGTALVFDRAPVARVGTSVVAWAALSLSVGGVPRVGAAVGDGATVGGTLLGAGVLVTELARTGSAVLVAGIAVGVGAAVAASAPDAFDDKAVGEAGVAPPAGKAVTMAVKVVGTTLFTWISSPPQPTRRQDSMSTNMVPHQACRTHLALAIDGALDPEIRMISSLKV